MDAAPDPGDKPLQAIATIVASRGGAFARVPSVIGGRMRRLRKGFRRNGSRSLPVARGAAPVTAVMALLVLLGGLRPVSAAQPPKTDANAEVLGLQPGPFVDSGSNAPFSQSVTAPALGKTALPYSSYPLPDAASGQARSADEINDLRSRSRGRPGDDRSDSRFQRLPVLADDSAREPATRATRRPMLYVGDATPTLDGAIPLDSSIKAAPSALSKRGDLSVRDISLREALLMISEIWETSIVVGDHIDGNVSGVFKNAPLSEVLDALLLANGYSYRPIGASLVVMKADQVGDINPMFESAAIACGACDPKELADSAKLLLSPRGKVTAMESSSGLLVVDYPDRVAAVRKLVADLNRTAFDPEAGDSTQLQVMHYHPQYLASVDLIESVKTVLSRDGKVSAMIDDNMLVILDAAPRLALVKQLLTRIDLPRAQVRITALIYDISLEDIEKLGINWNNKAKARYDAAGNPQTTFQIDSVQYVPPASGNVNGAISFMNLSRNFDLTTVMQALSQCKDSRLLADPNVTVVDNGRAVMKIVTEIPYQQLTQTQQGGNIGTTAFREAGITLNVVPRIAADGTMYLTIMPSFSRLTGFTPGSNPQPILDRREVTAIVRVANLQTLVIGGLRQRRDIGDFNGVIGLKDIKGIGKLFRSRDTTVSETELVVFIRPEIITPFDSGEPRQGAAHELLDAMLDQVPVAAGPQPKRLACPPDAVPPSGSYYGPAPTPADSSVTPEELPRPTPAASAAKPKPPEKTIDGRDPTFWEKHFGSKDYPSATLVERKPLRPGFDDRYHDRKQPRYGDAEVSRIRSQTNGQGRGAATTASDSDKQKSAGASGEKPNDSAARDQRTVTPSKKPSMWAKLFGPKPKPAAEVADQSTRIQR